MLLPVVKAEGNDWQLLRLAVSALLAAGDARSSRAFRARDLDAVMGASRALLAAVRAGPGHVTRASVGCRAALSRRSLPRVDASLCVRLDAPAEPNTVCVLVVDEARAPPPYRAPRSALQAGLYNDIAAPCEPLTALRGKKKTAATKKKKKHGSDDDDDDDDDDDNHSMDGDEREERTEAAETRAFAELVRTGGSDGVAGDDLDEHADADEQEVAAIAQSTYDTADGFIAPDDDDEDAAETVRRAARRAAKKKKKRAAKAAAAAAEEPPPLQADSDNDTDLFAYGSTV